MAEISYPHEDYPAEGEAAVTEAEYAAGIGWATPSGLIGSPGEAAPLYLAGGNLWLRAETTARLVGMAYRNADADLMISGIGANGSGSTRLDHIVLRLSWSTMLVRAAVSTGVPGGGLPPLTLQRGTGRYEMSLGQLAIPAGGSVATATLTRLGWYIGPGGQILCTEDTMPPHEQGRRVYQVDTGRALMSTGSAPWLYDVDDSGVVTLPLTADWSATANLLRRRNGWASLALSVRRLNNSLGAGTYATVGTLPVGYRPAFAEPFEGLAYSPSTGPGRYTVTAAGQVQVAITDGLPVSRFAVLHPITFPVA
ncbi:hypothetical protein AB0B27_13950 [Micromonospora rifamycinica]|uniref:hypothetical protein n=1 Tax=Micromonospora rifamycinica TaxID=291594 RepID=UPI0033D33471